MMRPDVTREYRERERRKGENVRKWNQEYGT
jgi:hypothetical protein